MPAFWHFSWQIVDQSQFDAAPGMRVRLMCRKVVHNLRGGMFKTMDPIDPLAVITNFQLIT